MALAQQDATHDLGVDPSRIAEVYRSEKEIFLARTPGSRTINERASSNWVHGVPLHWMNQWSSPYPIAVERAEGATLWDVDGHQYADFCLGDSGALFGHANPAIAQAIAEQFQNVGTTAMLPSADLVTLGTLLERNFGLPQWQMAVSASDANRFALRLSRMITGRDKVLVFNGKYHGSVDETQVELDPAGAMQPQHGVAPNAVDFDRTSVVIEYNDIAALEDALKTGEVACVMAEPMMTNIGMVPAHEGFNDALLRLTRDTGTLLVMDETHTICAGPGGWCGANDFAPDFIVCGKVLAGGIPSAVYGMSAEVAKQVAEITGEPGINHFGFGGTLAGNFATVRAMVATLQHVATAENYSMMTAAASELEGRITQSIRSYNLPWHVSRIGARVEYLFRPTPPNNGGEAGAARSDELEAVMHLYLLNRGVLRSPFHNMALVSPATSTDQLDLYAQVFHELLGELKR